MALIPSLLEAVRFVTSRVDIGLAVASGAAEAATGATSLIGRHRSNQRYRAISGPQAEAWAAAIEVELLSESWRARYRLPEDETRWRLCLCTRDR
jgi:hypothetical protein